VAGCVVGCAQLAFGGLWGHAWARTYTHTHSAARSCLLSTVHARGVITILLTLLTSGVTRCHCGPRPWGPADSDLTPARPLVAVGVALPCQEPKPAIV
jgi:hypothetical protein